MPALRFGFVGILAEHKGVHILIEAFNRVQDRDVVLNIYGHNDFNLRYVKRLKAMNRNTATRFQGKFDHDSLAEVYSNIDVLVMPATCFENFKTSGSFVLMKAAAFRSSSQLIPFRLWIRIVSTIEVSR